MKKWKKATIVVIVLLVALSATAATKGPDWLKKAVFYQIYPSSYKDSNGDGIGDIPGIISKLDYIQSIGVNAIWLNPLFESGWYDGGYDVIDFYKVDPRFGTNTDLVRLIEEAHQRGIKVCLDLVLFGSNNLWKRTPICNTAIIIFGLMKLRPKIKKIWTVGVRNPILQKAELENG